MTSDQLQKYAESASKFLATIPALSPYTLPISLALGIAATVAPEIYEEIKVLISKNEPVTEEQSERLHKLVLALKSPDDYFNDGHAAGVKHGLGLIQEDHEVAALLAATAPAPTPEVAFPAATVTEQVESAVVPPSLNYAHKEEKPASLNFLG